jgi:hypothetical protein
MALGVRALAFMALAGSLVAGGFAVARGPNMNLPIFGATPGDFYPHSFGAGRWRAPGGERPAPKPSGVAAFGYGKPVCVRLCDGFFFPTASVSGGEAACAAACPDAPTALYTMPSDHIEDAVSDAGAPYTALPVAKRYQTSLDATCACHRDAVAGNAMREIMADTTLRKGDVVMTPNGFRVYEGGGHGPSGPRDFVAPSDARLPNAERAALASMERANAGSPEPSAPARAAKRPRSQRGHVTVESSQPR